MISIKEFTREIQKQGITYQAKLFLHRKNGQAPICIPFFSVTIHPKNGLPMKFKNFIGDPVFWDKNSNDFSHDRIVATIVHQLHKKGPSISSIYIKKMFSGIHQEIVALVSSVSK